MYERIERYLGKETQSGFMHKIKKILSWAGDDVLRPDSTPYIFA